MTTPSNTPPVEMPRPFMERLSYYIQSFSKADKEEYRSQLLIEAQRELIAARAEVERLKEQNLKLHQMLASTHTHG